MSLRPAFPPKALILLLALTSQPARAQDSELAKAEEAILVEATRSGRRVQDEPIRVDVIGREEIDEKLLMTPGSIAMLMAETGGLRVQVTSPALGAANVRVRGLEGRYTQLLADGLPLYGGQTASLGLLQVPPTDLGQVEVIKGAASALYGPSALGGVVNLVARRPGPDLYAELLLNATSRNGADATGWLSAPLGGAWSGSLTGGLHGQQRQDLDEDGWADMPGFTRATVRPRLFRTGADGSRIFATLGALRETRRGGTLPGRVVPDGTPFVQAQATTRLDAGLIATTPVAGVGTVQLRASGMTQRHDRRFGGDRERDRHATLFGELSLAGRAQGTSWLAGLAFQLDDYRSRTFPAFDYSFEAPAVFGQVEQELGANVTLAGSARLDLHSKYGTRLSPRLSALWRPGDWSVRASLARGFFAPTPFVDRIEATGLSRLQPLAGLRAETADTASVDIGYAAGGIEIVAALFAARVENAVRLEPVPGAARVRLANVAGETRTRGLELLMRRRWDELSLTGSYVLVDATEPAGGGRRTVERTPRHSAGLVGMWEREGAGRIGIEAYYTGRQSLEDNPYRARGRPYVELGILAEWVLGPVSLFVNAENLLNVRQTRWNPLVLPARARDGRWTVDVWAPTEGFTVNAGVRLRLGEG